MWKINRRDFLKASVSTALTLEMPWLLTGCDNDNPDQKPIQEKNAQVAAIRGDNLYTMTRDAIDALGGMETFVNENETVFIKPNFVTFPWAPGKDCFGTGECTKPEIIIAVTEACLMAGAAEVIIGDGTQVPTFEWHYAITLDGSTNLMVEAERLSALYGGKVTLACLETDSPGWVEIPSSTSLNKIAISSLVAYADKVISIPVAKTHSWAQVTLAAKNFIGITPMLRYGQFMNNSYWFRTTFDHSSPQSIAQVYLDIVKGIEPDLCIIDFSIGVEGDGPGTGQGGITLNMKDHIGSWAMIASSDIMAVDATAARIMDHDTSQVSHLSMGFNMGLGEIREQCIEILGEKIDNLRVPYKPANLQSF